MTVPNLVPQIKYPYTGPGDYTFPFPIFEDSNLECVYFDEDGVPTELTLGVDYTVTLAVEAPSAGEVTLIYDTALVGVISIERHLPLVQGTDWVNNDPFNADQLEDDLDKIVMLIQDGVLAIELAVSISSSYPTGFAAIIPYAEPGHGFKVAEDSLSLVPTDSPIDDIISGAESARDGAEIAEGNALVSATNSANCSVESFDSKEAAAASASQTAADVISTNADVLLTNADVVTTNADATQTGLDVVTTGEDVVATNADVVLTHADVVLTGLDVVATGADATQTGLDVVSTNADAISTSDDVVITNADVVLCDQAVLDAQAAAITSVQKTSDTGSAKMPAGTTAQRDGTPLFGYTRANSTTGLMEWWNNTAWVEMGSGGGATGGGTDEVFYENDTNVTTDYTLTASKNAVTAGPITVDAGATVTVPTGSVWTVV